LFFFFEEENATEGNKKRPSDSDKGRLNGSSTIKSLIEKEEGKESTKKFKGNDLTEIFEGKLFFELRLTEKEGNDDR